VVSFLKKILLRKYLGKAETKSLGPDGATCTGSTRGLLQRARITAEKLVPVGKETDRRWDQGDDPSMIDPDIYVYEKREKLEIAQPAERKKWTAIGLNRLRRESKLSQTPVSNALKGIGVRPRTLSIIRQTADRLVAEYSTNSRELTLTVKNHWAKRLDLLREEQLRQ
jgi:hypothetical protein